MTLPITPLLPRIAESLTRATRLVLVAPPGAGKTTCVPPALLDAPWLGGRKIVMLEPRRLAARAAARRIASQRRERVGETVGYRVHLDTVVGPRTRIEVVTEGVLTRMLQSDPTLDDVGVVIFDEFHERSIHADLGLALTLHAQRLVRDDLRIVVMSATLDGEGVARVIDAPVIQSEGRAFPVETRYWPRRDRERVDDALVRVTRSAIAESEGDILCFLPGGAEIRRVADTLRDTITDRTVDIRPLYGDLAGEEQDAAIAPSPPGRRKIVVATNIAESSLTIEGVRVVVDAGLARAPRFSPRTGLTRLETVRISRASADQRRGRAGRTAPGVCYRLWAEADDHQLAPRTVPEILESDLAPLALELARAGIHDPTDLTWIDAPPAGALAQGRALLERLGLSLGASSVSSLAASVAALPAHPRIATMLAKARDTRHAALACDIAALLGNRDIMRPTGPGARVDADLRTRIEIVNGARADTDTRVDRDALRRIRQEAAVWRDRLGVPNAARDLDATGTLLAFAYPDRVARARRGDVGRYVLANGTGAHFETPDALGAEEWLVIAETDGRVPESRIYLAAPTSLDALLASGAAKLETSDVVEWDDDGDRVMAVRRTTLGDIIVKEQPLRDPSSELVQAALLAAVRRAGIDALPWSENASEIRKRLAFLRANNETWPDVSDAALLRSMDEWLAPIAVGAHSLRDIGRADLTQGLLNLLDWKQRADLDRLAPTHIEVPSGSSIHVDYSDPQAPSIAVRLQELYGLKTTPTVMGGATRLTLHLLSPAHRPVQVTRDLAAFWRGSYAEVRKDMRGRYPKHDWPEDPANAVASRGRRRLAD